MKFYMKLVNKSEEFVVYFDGGDYKIPKGAFEVINEKLGNHILNKATKWQKMVSMVPAAPISQVKSIDMVVTEPVAEETKTTPAFGGATMETLPKKMGRPRKNDVKQIA